MAWRRVTNVLEGRGGLSGRRLNTRVRRGRKKRRIKRRGKEEAPSREKEKWGWVR